MDNPNLEICAETVTVPLAEWQRMQDRLDLLDALEAEGVDNWHGYDYARKSLREQPDG